VTSSPHTHIIYHKVTGAARSVTGAARSVTGAARSLCLERDDGQRGRVPVEYLHKETVLFNRPPLTNIRSSKHAII
jgi:hypothetical protein